MLKKVQCQCSHRSSFPSRVAPWYTDYTTLHVFGTEKIWADCWIFQDVETNEILRLRENKSSDSCMLKLDIVPIEGKLEIRSIYLCIFERWDALFPSIILINRAVYMVQYRWLPRNRISHPLIHLELRMIDSPLELLASGFWCRTPDAWCSDVQKTNVRNHSDP